MKIKMIGTPLLCGPTLVDRQSRATIWAAASEHRNTVSEPICAGTVNSRDGYVFAGSSRFAWLTEIFRGKQAVALRLALGLLVNGNVPFSHRSLECRMVTLCLIRVGQCKFAHRSIECIVR